MLQKFFTHSFGLVFSPCFNDLFLTKHTYFSIFANKTQFGLYWCSIRANLYWPIRGSNHWDSTKENPKQTHIGLLEAQIIEIPPKKTQSKPILAYYCSFKYIEVKQTKNNLSPFPVLTSSVLLKHYLIQTHIYFKIYILILKGCSSNGWWVPLDRYICVLNNIFRTWYILCLSLIQLVQYEYMYVEAFWTRVVFFFKEP